MREIDLDQFLYCVEDEDGDESFVVAPTLSAATQKWKEVIADYINEDLKSDGIDRTVSPEEIPDPTSVNLIAESDQLML